MLVCSNCGHDNPGNMLACESCGAKLSARDFGFRVAPREGDRATSPEPPAPSGTVPPKAFRPTAEDEEKVIEAQARKEPRFLVRSLLWLGEANRRAMNFNLLGIRFETRRSAALVTLGAFVVGGAVGVIGAWL